MNKREGIFYLQSLFVVKPVVAVEVREHVVEHLQFFLRENVIQELPDEDDHNQLKLEKVFKRLLSDFLITMRGKRMEVCFMDLIIQRATKQPIWIIV